MIENEASEFFDSTKEQPTSCEIYFKSGGHFDVFKKKVYNKWHIIKRVQAEKAENPVYIEALKREFELGYQLDHPNIVRYNDFGHDEQGYYIRLEFIDGLTLREFFVIHHHKDLYKVLYKVSIEILEALEYLHKKQIYHLDLKPENILITYKGENVKIIDLGLSISDSHEAIRAGTISYASPEQIYEPKIIDGRSDLYSFGLILEEALSVASKRKTFIREPYKEIIRKCKQPDPKNRFAHANDIIELLVSHKKKQKIIRLSILGVVMILLFGIISTILLRHKTTSLNSNTNTTKNIDSVPAKNKYFLNPTNSMDVNVTKPKNKVHPKKTYNINDDSLTNRIVLDKFINDTLLPQLKYQITPKDSIAIVNEGERVWSKYSPQIFSFDEVVTGRRGSRIIRLIQLKDSFENCIYKDTKYVLDKYELGSVQYCRTQTLVNHIYKLYESQIDSIIPLTHIKN